MDVSAISGFNPTLNLINALYPASRVTPASGLGSVLSLTALGSTQTSISNLGRLLSAAESLAAAGAALTAPDALAARSAASSGTAVATATAGSGTPTGIYNLQVNQLAQAQTLTTAAQPTSLAALGSGAATLTFQFASGVSRQVSVDSGDNTLSGIANAINAADIGIKASVTSSAAGYQLSLTGQTGAANAFTLGVSGNSTVADLLAYPGATGVPVLTSQARNAEGVLNGTAFSASTNTVNTAVDDLTLKLQGTGASTLTVAVNTEQIQKVSAFVEAYNAVQTGLARLSQENPGLGLNAFYLRNELAGALDATGSGLGGAVTTLAQAGIATTANGTLTLDTSKFQAALAARPEEVALLFSNGGKGIAERTVALTSGPLAAGSLLELARPAIASPANLAQVLQADLLAPLAEQQDLTENLNSLVNLSNQFLLSYLSAGSQPTGGGNGISFLDLYISQSKALSQNLSSLGTQLNLVGLL